MNMPTPTTKTIEITVTPEGTVSIKTSGFTGSSCKDATRELERALGVSGRESLLPEFYDQASTGQQIQQGQ
jgi:spore coat protein U-like protein